jgi:hypothetical protein
VALVLPAVLLAQVSAASEQRAKVSNPSKPSTRTPGAPISTSSELAAFLQMNPEERFDLEAINSVDAQALLAETRGDKRVLREVTRTAQALLPRVRAETEDPILVSAILRNKTLDWYRRSPSDPRWAEVMPLRWGGIFHESRVPGGRLSRKLSARLTNLIEECVQASGTIAFLRAGVNGLFRGSALMASMVQFGLGSKRPRYTQQVAQAYLDDLAATARDGDQYLPLERLSALARRTTSQDVNMTLVELFPQEVAGILTVLDPRFHPGMTGLSIRVVPPKTQEDASTYDLLQANAPSSKESGPVDSGTPDATPASPWEQHDMTNKDWLGLLRTLARRKVRLERPPRDNPRDREAYITLRELLVADSSARKAFLAVHWKGKPSGLALLCQLLSEGTLTPDVETDADYLEAELDHPGKTNADRRAKEGQWSLGHRWTVVREVGEAGARTYRAHGKSGD